MIKERNEWTQLFDKIRKTYFESWNKSASLAEREAIYKKMDVLKEIEKELMIEMQGSQLTELKPEGTAQNQKSHYYRYRSLY